MHSHSVDAQRSPVWRRLGYWPQVPLAPPQASLEAMQWIAFVCMVADHIGYLLLGQEVSWLRGLGRLTFPLFAIVFAWRLADLLARDPQRSTWPMMTRLLVSGLVAHAILAVQWPDQALLNIMFSFAAALAIIQLCQPSNPEGATRSEMAARYVGATALVMLAGVWVDYGDWGILMILSLYSFFRWGSATTALAVALCVVFVSFVHPLHLAVLALPVAWVVIRQGWGFQRMVRHLFYWLYPAHLLALALVASFIEAK